MKALCFRGSLLNVYFPSVTLCNINQGRSSLFHQFGLSENNTLLTAVLKQAYFGSSTDLNPDLLQEVADKIFANEEVVTKGNLADFMFQESPYRRDSLKNHLSYLNQTMNGTSMLELQMKERYVREAGWYFKTLAVQEIGTK